MARGGRHSFVGGSREKQGTGAPLLGGTSQGRPGRSEADDGPHFVDHNLRHGQKPDREGYLRVVAEEQTAFSHIRYIIENQIAEGDKVMTRWTGSGVHDRGQYQGFAPTGRWSADKIIDVHRIEGGKIAEEWKGASTIAALQVEHLTQVERERVEQELRVARSIQQASLPKEVPELEVWQISPLYRPASARSGDLLGDG